MFLTTTIYLSCELILWEMETRAHINISKHPYEKIDCKILISANKIDRIVGYRYCIVGY
jgi:hypothetical protein